MKDYKSYEGFLVLDPTPLPESLLNEVRHYNGLLKSTKATSFKKQTLISSEDKIVVQLKDIPGSYPFIVTYGYMPILSLFMTKPVDGSEVLKQIRKCRNDFGDEYFHKLLLFDPSELNLGENQWGWAANGSYLEGQQNNVFMLAVQSGDIKLVKSLLDLLDEPELKKKVLLQSMQYFVGNQLLFRPILKIAINSGSVEMVNYLMETMDQLNILSDASSEYTSLVSTDDSPTNLLQDAVKSSNDELIETVLRFKDKLGPVNMVLTACTYPDYIITGVSNMPVFIQAIASKNSRIFERVFVETMRSIEIKDSDTFLEANFKVHAMISVLGRVNLGLYLRHEHFNPQIFAKLLQLKLDINKQLEQLKYKKNYFSARTGIPFPSVKSGEIDQVVLSDRKNLWYGTVNIGNPKVAEEQLRPVNVLYHLFYYAVSAKNYVGAVVVLYEFFQEGYIDDFGKILKQQSRPEVSIFANLLLIKAISEQNFKLIEYLSKTKFNIRIEAFQTIFTLDDPHTQVLVAKELFHQFHINNFKYSDASLDYVLNELSILANNHKDDRDLKESIVLFLEEILQNRDKTKSSAFFKGSKNINSIEKLLNDLRKEIQNSMDLPQ